MNNRKIKSLILTAILLCCFNLIYAQGGCQYPCTNLVSDPGFENQTMPIPSDYASQHYTNDASSVNPPWCGLAIFGNTFLLVDPYPGVNNYPGSLGWYQTVAVKKNTEYCFSFWTRNVKNDPNKPDIVFDINGSQQTISAIIGGVTVTGTSIQLPYDSDCSEWIQVWGNWNSGNNTLANLGIATILVSGPGNDFGLDNINFAENSPSCCTTEIIGSYGPFCEDDNNTYSLMATPAGGTWKINGTVFNGQITPSVLGDGSYTIVYEESNGCSDQIVVDIADSVNPVINDPGILCENQGLVTLSATQSGGTFSGPGIIGDQFDPSIGKGTYTITYTLSIGSCTGSDDIDIIVEELPVVTLTTPHNISCESDAPFKLFGKPTGGSYSGNGMTGSQFDPKSAGPGIHTITYSVTVGSCTASKEVDIEVIGNAVIDQDDMDLCAPSVTLLTAQPVGGSWTMNGIPFSGLFDAGTAGTGTFEIIYTSPSPCVSADTIYITVADAAACCSNPAFETVWSNDTIVNNDVANSIKMLDDCSYIVAGASHEFSVPIPTITKLNTDGTVQWHREYTNTTFIKDLGEFYNIEETYDFGYLVSGWVETDNSQDYRDFVIMKTDMTGDPIWAWHSSFEAEDYLWDIEETHDSSVIAVGRGVLDQMLVIILLDKNGIHQWTTFYNADLGYSNITTGYSIEEIDDNQDGIAEEGYIITGQQTGADGFSLNQDFIFVLQIAPDGSPLQSYYIPGVEGQGKSIKQIKDANNVAIPGNYAITGYVYQEVQPTPHNDAFLLQINMYTGQYQLDIIGTTENEIGYAIEQKSDTSFVIGGNAEVQGQDDGLLLEVSDNSVLNWDQVFGDEFNDDGIRSIDLTTQRDILFAGYSPRYINALSSNDNFYIGRTNPFGKTGCSRETDLTLTTSTGMARSFLFLSDTLYHLQRVEMEDDLLANDESGCEIDLRAKKGKYAVELVETTSQSDIYMYPQPLKNGSELQLSFNMTESEKVNVQVSDIQGKTVYKEQLKLVKGKNRKSLKLNVQGSGVYSIQIEGSSIQYVSKLLIID